MALGAATNWEIETGGSDTANGGAFDPGQTAGMFSDGAATSANTASPVFTSASYNFVAGDVNAWLFIASGTNWTAGWYQIVSVAANAATLSAAAGAGALRIYSPTTAAGCATVASPTSATWSIDYSQQASAQFTYTDLASSGTGLTVSSAAKPFAKQQVGNAIVITGGTNFNTGRYVIASVAAAVATVVGPTNITTGAGASGIGAQGGALASPAMPPAVAGNNIFIKSGTYSITSSSANVSGGKIDDTVGKNYEGYGTVRGDLGTAPLLQVSGAISNFIIFSKTGNSGPTFSVRNLTLDGAAKATMTGWSSNQNFLLTKVSAVNCTTQGFDNTGGNGRYYYCKASVCGKGFNAGVFYAYCEAFSNTGIGFAGTSTIAIGCLSYSNSGGSSDGFSFGGSGAVINCIAYGNGRRGFDFSPGTSSSMYWVTNCIAEGNGTGYYGPNSTFIMFDNCLAYNNTTNIATNLTGPQVANEITIASGSPFTAAGSGDFSLNSTAGAGVLARGGGAPRTWPAGTSTGYQDIGAIQHADPVAVAGATQLVNGGLVS